MESLGSIFLHCNLNHLFTYFRNKGAIYVSLNRVNSCFQNKSLISIGSESDNEENIKEVNSAHGIH